MAIGRAMMILIAAFCFAPILAHSEKIKLYNNVSGTLFLDNESVGEIQVHGDEPYLLPGVEPGRHQLRLTPLSGSAIERSVEVSAGSDKVVRMISEAQGRQIESGGEGNHSFWRSLLVPGLSQFHRGDTLSGSLFLGGTLCGAIGSAYFSTAGDQSFAAYKNATSTESAKANYDQALSQDSMYTVFSYAAIGIYLWNIADAMVYGDQGSREGKVGAAPSLAPRIAIRRTHNKTEQLVLEWSL